MATWSPTTYLQFGDERGRPFFDLTARVLADAPRRVVDLGCGPGQLTATLAHRWPTAQVEGLDSSPEMIAAAQEHASDRVHFAVADVAEWHPREPPDVIVSNALLQWVPEHRELLPHLVEMLAPGGWLAVQVPGNYDEPSHTLLRDLAGDSRFTPAGSVLSRRPVPDAATYLADLAQLGCEVDAWETTYLHVLTGPDPVFRWISGTGARPVLQALSDEQRAQFVPEYQALLREAYPEQPFGTVLPFRRIFAVAHKVAQGVAEGVAEGAAQGARAGGRIMTALHHVQVSCPAEGEAPVRAFYGGLLGLAEVAKPPELAKRGGVWFRGDGYELHVGVEDPFVPAAKAHPAFLVTDVDSLADRLGAAGYQVTWDGNFPGYRRFHTHDPHGNRVEVLGSLA